MSNDTGSKTCFKILTREKFPNADGINHEQSSSVKSGEIALSNDVVEKSNVGNLKLTINTTGKSLKLKGIISTANENAMVERYDKEAVEINKRSSKCALKDFLPQILRMTIPRKHPISLPATIFRISSLTTRML